MIPTIVIRPEPGCAATVAAARAMGLEAHGFPLFEVLPRDWSPPAAGDVDALLIGSANALRLGGSALETLRDLPVYAVGAATAEAARDAGFSVAATGIGGLQNLLANIPAGTRLLRLAGEQRVPLTPPEGVTMIERLVYASEARTMPRALAGLVRQSVVVLLHSGEAAAHFASECDRLGIAREVITIAALAPRIAEAAGHGWAALATAETATDAALLALTCQLCQSSGEKRG